MNETRARVLSLILSSEVGMSQRELVCHIGRSRKALQKHAAALRDAGMVSMVGSGRGARWCRPGAEVQTMVEIRIQQVRAIMPDAPAMIVLNAAARLERRNAYRRGDMQPPRPEPVKLGPRSVFELAMSQ